MVALLKWKPVEKNGFVNQVVTRGEVMHKTGDACTDTLLELSAIPSGIPIMTRAQVLVHCGMKLSSW